MSRRGPLVGVMLRHVSHPGGITVFTRHVVRYLVQNAGPISYRLLYMAEAQQAMFADLAAEHVVLPGASKLLWDQALVPSYARRAGLDVVFNAKLSVPLSCSARTMFFLPGAEQFAARHAFPWSDRLYTRLMMPRFCSKAAAILTLTEQAKTDIVHFLGADPAKIHVVGAAADSSLKPASEAAQRAVRAKLGLARRYVLFLGQLGPLKNVANLVHAFALLRDRHDIDLVLAGPRRPGYEADLRVRETLGLQGRVHELGFVPDSDLAALYSAAECFVLPSWYEGFGIPIIEAMACGCPVVASVGRCCPEVAGGAAVLVDPARPTSIAEGIERLLIDHRLRLECIAKGLERAAAFDWSATTQRVERVIARLCGIESPRGGKDVIGTPVTETTRREAEAAS